ncbi:hypothetical protein [Luteibacter sp. W1I16]|uniref:hypothetical protein n=1 Tax=Luteibacter sp. W1I16 TaxID=3373922 RepID=UPI003D1915A5
MSDPPERLRILFIDFDSQDRIGFETAGVQGEALVARLSCAPAPPWSERFLRIAAASRGVLARVEVVGSTIRFLALRDRSTTAIGQLSNLVEEVNNAADACVAPGVSPWPEELPGRVHQALRRGRRQTAHRKARR